MFWMIKRLFWLGVIAALVYFGLQYKINDRPVKDYAVEFYKSPLVQAVMKTGKEMAQEFWDEQMGDGASSKKVPVDDHINQDDQEALNKVIEQQQ